MISVVVLSALIKIYPYYPRIFNPLYLPTEDAKGYLSIVLAWANQAILPDHFVNTFLVSRIIPGVPGYFLLYRILYNYFSLSDSLLIVGLLMLVLTAVYAFKLGEALGSITTGIVFALLLVLLFFAPFYGTTLSFGFGLSLAFLYYLVKRQYLGSIITLVMAALFYPHLLPVLLLTWAIKLFAELKEQKFKPDKEVLREAVFFATGSLSVVALMIPAVVTNGLSEQPYSNYMESFSVAGRHAITPGIYRFVFGYVGALWRHKRETLLVLGILAILIRVSLGFKGIKYKSELTYFLLAGIVAYALAWILFPRLYFPERQTYFVFPIALLAFVVLNFGGMGQLIESTRVKTINQLGVLIIIMALVVPYSLMVVKRTWALQNYINPEPSSYRSALINQVAQMPVDTVLAGHPNAQYILDIPVFTDRSIFLNNKVFGMFESFGASEETEKIIVDYFKAFYAPTMQEVQDFCNAYGVDYMIVDTDLYEEHLLSARPIYYSPYNDLIVEYLDNLEDPHFALSDPPADKVAYEVEDLVIVSCGN